MLGNTTGEFPTRVDIVKRGLSALRPCHHQSCYHLIRGKTSRTQIFHLAGRRKRRVPIACRYPKTRALNYCKLTKSSIVVMRRFRTYLPGHITGEYSTLTETCGARRGPSLLKARCPSKKKRRRQMLLCHRRL